MRKLQKHLFAGVLEIVFLKTLQYSQENTCVGVSFLTLLKRDSNTGVFL